MSKDTKSEKELLADLKKQIVLMKNSTNLFDNGCEFEAINLATRIRVLVHDTNYSISLLKQLNKKDTLFYDSAVPFIPDTSKRTCFQTPCLTSIRMSTKDGVSYIASPDDREMTKIEFSKWWEDNIILIDTEGNRFNRKELVLNVADCDGGAHIDPKLKHSYVNISIDNKVGLKAFSKGKKDFQNRLVFPSIRRISHEVFKTLVDEFPDLFKEASNANS